MTDVKCKVESCYYWGSGDVCKADSIMVDNNTVGGVRSTPMEAGNLDVNRPSGRSAQSTETGSDRTFGTGADRGTTGTGNRNRTGRFDAADLTTGSVIGGSTKDFEAGDITAGTLTGTNKTLNEVLARTSHETLCSTFRPKGTEVRH